MTENAGLQWRKVLHLELESSQVTIDGMNMGTPEDGTRSTPLDVIPSDSTERLKVVKSPTPD
ncbi:hypothetical protein DXO116_19565, partial [Xanthomonas oryzae pv. oryzae]